jgi:hypothetical protein
VSASAHITPEIEELLSEIAGDPDAKLLRIPAPQAVRAAFDERIDVAPHSTGLTVAERQLVQVHHAELAYVLRLACVDRLHNSEVGSQRMIRDVRPDARIPVTAGDQARRLAHDALAKGCARLSDVGDELTWLLELLAGMHDGQSVAVTQLASMSLRLQPTRQGRCYQALDLAFCGEAERALKLFTELAEMKGDRENQAIAWTSLAMIYSDIDRPHEEYHANVQACALDSRILMAQLNRLIGATELNLHDEAKDSAAQLDELIDEAHPALSELMLHAQRVFARSSRAASGVMTARDQLASQLGPVSTRILYARC